MSRIHWKIKPSNRRFKKTPINKEVREQLMKTGRKLRERIIYYPKKKRNNED